MGLACVFRNVGFPPLPLDARSGEGRAGRVSSNYPHAIEYAGMEEIF